MRTRLQSAGIAGRPEALAALILALGVPTAAAPQGDLPAAATGAEAPVPGWSGRASASWYFLPDQPDYLLPTAAADHGTLHLEARYNYEDRETGSLFVGWNFEAGDELQLQVVPMLGGVAGRTSGVAPGLELTLGWAVLQYYLETEVVFDLGDFSKSYFYAWSELTASPTHWLHAGVVVQRTRAIKVPRDVSPGLLVRVSAWRVEAGFSLFNPGADGQYAALSAGVHFE